MTRAAPLIFVTVGTDHHPFDRLVRWIDEWLESCDVDVRCFIQTGTSIVPSHAEHGAYLTYQEMTDRIAQSNLVVCHGGPGTIAMCWRGRRRPVVVPRRPDLGEHVDEHQVVFARRLATGQSVHVAEDEPTLSAFLSRAPTEPALGRLTGEAATNGEEAVQRFAELVDGLLAKRYPGSRSRGIT